MKNCAYPQRTGFGAALEFLPFWGVTNALAGLVAVAAISILVGCASRKPSPAPSPSSIQARRYAENAVKLSQQNNWAAAAVQWQEAVNRYQALGDLAGEAIALHNLGFAKFHAGDPESARAAVDSAAELNRETGRRDEWWRNQILALQIEAASGSADFEAHLERLRPEAARMSNPEIRALFLNEIALWNQQNGQFEEALENFRTAEKWFAKSGSSAGLGVVTANLAALHYEREDYRAALDGWARARRFFEQLGEIRGIARANAGFGKTLLAVNRDLDEAEKVLRRASDAYHLLRMPREEERALRLLLAVARAENKNDMVAEITKRLEELSASRPGVPP